MKKQEWEACQLKEVITDPKFLGRTVRLGNEIFEVKGVLKGLKSERN